ILKLVYLPIWPGLVISTEMTTPARSRRSAARKRSVRCRVPALRTLRRNGQPRPLQRTSTRALRGIWRTCSAVMIAPPRTSRPRSETIGNGLITDGPLCGAGAPVGPGEMNVFGEADDWVESVPEPLTVSVWNAVAVAPVASLNAPSPSRSHCVRAIVPSGSVAADVNVTVSPSTGLSGLYV